MVHILQITERRIWSFHVVVILIACELDPGENGKEIWRARNTGIRGAKRSGRERSGLTSLGLIGSLYTVRYFIEDGTEMYQEL